MAILLYKDHTIITAATLDKQTGKFIPLASLRLEASNRLSNSQRANDFFPVLPLLCRKPSLARRRRHDIWLTKHNP